MKHTQEELQAIVEPLIVESAIDKLIQDEIEAYNKANYVSFKNINAISKYTVVPTYTHIDFCNSVLTWNTEVWETSRQLQRDIHLGVIEKPESVEAFLALLPKRE